DDSTVAQNVGGGLFFVSGSTASPRNTLIALNPGGDCAGAEAVSSRGHNLDSDNTCHLDPASADLPNITDPRLAPLAGNGGADPDARLAARQPGHRPRRHVSEPRPAFRGTPHGHCLRYRGL